ncbi:MAG: PIN domain-containing protein [Candidatus Nitrosotenuis sp.]
MNVVFDTQALLIFYLGERGAERVEELLKQIIDAKISGYINVVNLAELYYVLGRKNKKIADEKEKNIRSFGVRIVPVSDGQIWREAALMKMHHSLSLADAFAAATAKILRLKLVTGPDPEFASVSGIQMERIGTK